jgi:hypothetical protein
MWSSKGKRMLENEKTQGDMSILREANIVKCMKPSDKEGMTMLK